MGLRGELNLSFLSCPDKEKTVDPVLLLSDPDSILKFCEKNQFITSKGNVDLFKFSKEIGITVSTCPLDPGHAGALLLKDDSWEIILNKSEPEPRRRFTFAHELGHYFLHRKPVIDETINPIFHRDENKDSKEYAANSFAVNLLMPEDKIRERLSQTHRTVKALADDFEVSVQSMTYRLGELGYDVE